MSFYTDQDDAPPSDEDEIPLSASMQKALRAYERACSRAEKSKKANPFGRNHDCGAIIHAIRPTSQQGWTKAQIERSTRQHLLAMKIGVDAYQIPMTEINAAYRAEFGTLKGSASRQRR